MPVPRWRPARARVRGPTARYPCWHHTILPGALHLPVKTVWQHHMKFIGPFLASFNISALAVPNPRSIKHRAVGNANHEPGRLAKYPPGSFGIHLQKSIVERAREVISHLLSSKLPKPHPFTFEQQRYGPYATPLLNLHCGTAAYGRVPCRRMQKNGSVRR